MSLLTIFIPGIMGSSLKQPAAAGGMQLWSEDALASLSQITGRPALLQYSSSSSVEVGNVLEEIWVGGWKKSLCGRLRREMRKLEEDGQFLYDEFPYDWRQNIDGAARRLGMWLTANHGFTINDQGDQEQHQDNQLNIITHSMGSLVAALAIMGGCIHPSNVRRLICIGAPFLGAPASFSATYTTGYLPFMEWVEKWVNKGKNKQTRLSAILQALQSFISTFQLLPHHGHSFVKIKGGGWIHPLSDNIIDPAIKSEVIKIHTLMNSFEQFLVNNGITYHFIFGTSPPGWFGGLNNTPYQFKAKHGTNPVTGLATYEEVKPVWGGWTIGDGTVPVDSATIYRSGDPATRTGIPGVEHAYMCNNSTVVNKVKQLLI
jgi:pimeloyl-ACP methyl ester carboxylesterase